MFLAWIAKAASHPLVARVLVPALTQAIGNFLRNRAAKLELQSAIKSAKDARTVEELRDASEKLSKAVNGG